MHYTFVNHFLQFPLLLRLLEGCLEKVAVLKKLLEGPLIVNVVKSIAAMIVLREAWSE
jgi:hypothetical protein